MRSIVLLLSGIYVLASSAIAAETPWHEHLDMVRSRIVMTSNDMSDANKGPLLAWEAVLAPGWKTYWRSPGEAGLPVRLSQNDEEIEIMYPVPERFELFGLETYGYSHSVMLPFHLKKIEGESVTVQASFMVCKDICVPFDARYTVPMSDLNADFSPHDIRVAAWMKKVPEKDTDDSAGLAIDAVRVTGPVGRQRIIVDARADTQLDGADMLAEVNDMVHFGAPTMKLMGDGTQARFVLAAMTGKKAMDLRGQSVRLTFTDGKGHAIDRLVPLPKK